ncbi:hypothetical protein [Caldimonas tepidiphila]|uniref:hypothetical protein n=1 Tax=Caldimonas tepidiphila TaxID=2315841 RepID=UPI0013002B22|nr:hypothetical protein [Caldimonas tepidiphila]
MLALKLPGWLHLPMRRRKSVAAATDDPAAFGAELGLDLSLAPRPEAPPRTLPRSAEELRELRRRCAR